MWSVASLCRCLFQAVECLLKASQARYFASEAARHSGPNQGWSDALVWCVEWGTQRSCRVGANSEAQKTSQTAVRDLLFSGR
ncbi:hypothetical protein E2C01_046113 [Portunus trituberculatus]|uniref:Secreted protein n=1 Tax=Portunus trituberculatus TaxID=210409 RepID=A0A5B7FWY7_PORTR|nr:hypothetical protein [Portunus trituberculatus]